MLGKRILAGVFAGLILIKLVFLLINPNMWLKVAEALMGEENLVLAFYLVLILITGYYVFASMDLLDLAVAMFFTSMLIAFSLLPYAGTLFKLREEMVLRVSQAWLPMLLWGGLAVAVLVKVFWPGRDNSKRRNKK